MPALHPPYLSEITHLKGFLLLLLFRSSLATCRDAEELVLYIPPVPALLSSMHLYTTFGTKKLVI